jgi:hypothetical protein
MSLLAAVTLECPPHLRHACLVLWPSTSTGGSYTHCWRMVGCDKADPSMQHSLALQQKALLVRAQDFSVLAAGTAHEVRENFAPAADVTNKRHKSALEHPACRVKSRATKQPGQALAQQDFANFRKDESLLVSRAI